ncbi:MAG: hypothetical protein BWX72_00728 [Firmicutes bacterium ADurb.Bin080]|nr:MAG: hypothetical protein BWX72_00728 [Firmicutes bacterium ADurb.Bin080]
MKKVLLIIAIVLLLSMALTACTPEFIEEFEELSKFNENYSTARTSFDDHVTDLFETQVDSDTELLYQTDIMALDLAYAGELIYTASITYYNLGQSYTNQNMPGLSISKDGDKYTLTYTEESETNVVSIELREDTSYTEIYSNSVFVSRLEKVKINDVAYAAQFYSLEGSTYTIIQLLIDGSTGRMSFTQVASAAPTSIFNNAGAANEQFAATGTRTYVITDSQFVFDQEGDSGTGGNGFSVSFEENGGFAIDNLSEVTEIVSSPAVNRNGFIFEGWYTTASFDAGTRLVFPYSVTANITLYANWVEDDGTTYTVYFEENGGTGVADVIGEDINTQPVSTKDGFELEGWYTTSSFEQGTKVVFPYTPTQSITFYAKWTNGAYNSAEMYWNSINGFESGFVTSNMQHPAISGNNQTKEESLYFIDSVFNTLSSRESVPSVLFSVLLNTLLSEDEFDLANPPSEIEGTNPVEYTDPSITYNQATSTYQINVSLNVFSSQYKTWVEATIKYDETNKRLQGIIKTGIGVQQVVFGLIEYKYSEGTFESLIKIPSELSLEPSEYTVYRLVNNNAIGTFTETRKVLSSAILEDIYNMGESANITAYDIMFEFESSELVNYDNSLSSPANELVNGFDEMFATISSLTGAEEQEKQLGFSIEYYYGNMSAYDSYLEYISAIDNKETLPEMDGIEYTFSNGIHKFTLIDEDPDSEEFYSIQMFEESGMLLGYIRTTLLSDYYVYSGEDEYLASYSQEAESVEILTLPSGYAMQWIASTEYYDDQDSLIECDDNSYEYSQLKMFDGDEAYFVRDLDPQGLYSINEPSDYDEETFAENPLGLNSYKYVNTVLAIQ